MDVELHIVDVFSVDASFIIIHILFQIK